MDPGVAALISSGYSSDHRTKAILDAGGAQDVRVANLDETRAFRVLVDPALYDNIAQVCIATSVVANHLGGASIQRVQGRREGGRVHSSMVGVVSDAGDLEAVPETNCRSPSSKDAAAI